MNAAHRACPVVFRDPSLQEILAFEHPEKGLQLVKGRIEPGENPRAAALRELQEEAGLGDVGIATDLGEWQSGVDGQVWSLQLCTFKTRLPETWTHYCEDDGGHEFKFFWHDVNREPEEGWGPQYRRALEAIRDRTRSLRWRG